VTVLLADDTVTKDDKGLLGLGVKNGGESSSNHDC
jgi:hypothetical protein